MILERRPVSLALSLARLRRLGQGQGPSLGQAMASLKDHDVTVVTILLAILGTIPSPGLPLGFLCGLAVIWMAISWKSPSLPAGLARRRLPRAILDATLRRLLPPLRRMEKQARPRWPLLTGSGGVAAVRLAILLQGLVMALPIPLGNILPALSILLLAGGLGLHDGKGVLAGHAMAALSLALLGGMALGGWAALDGLGVL